MDETNVVYTSLNGYAKVHKGQDKLIPQNAYYAVFTYDVATDSYHHYMTFSNKRVAIDAAEGLSNR